MDDRTNTIAMMVLGAFAVALGSSLFVGEMFSSERPETMGYVVEGVELESEEGGEAEQPIAVFLAAGDAAAGEAVFKKCAACHTIDQGAPNGLGPNLYGVMGKPIASVAGFAYSDALAGKGGNWDWETMSAWLKKPAAFAQGTKMTFAGLSKPEDRANIMLYMNSKSGSPLPLPPVPAANTADQQAAEAGDAEADKAKDQPQIDVEDVAEQPGGNYAGEGAVDKDLLNDNGRGD